uniref:Uncharacterized protein n=1 Tax=Knipowitschia caucasica TaxID=637954 RepID=A0AAV2MFQ7_KNICA
MFEEAQTPKSSSFCLICRSLLLPRDSAAAAAGDRAEAEQPTWCPSRCSCCRFLEDPLCGAGVKLFNRSRWQSQARVSLLLPSSPTLRLDKLQPVSLLQRRRLPHMLHINMI